MIVGYDDLTQGWPTPSSTAAIASMWAARPTPASMIVGTRPVTGYVQLPRPSAGRGYRPGFGGVLESRASGRKTTGVTVDGVSSIPVDGTPAPSRWHR